MKMRRAYTSTVECLASESWHLVRLLVLPTELLEHILVLLCHANASSIQAQSKLSCSTSSVLPSLYSIPLVSGVIYLPSAILFFALELDSSDTDHVLLFYKYHRRGSSGLH